MPIDPDAYKIWFVPIRKFLIKGSYVLAQAINYMVFTAYAEWPDRVLPV